MYFGNLFIVKAFYHIEHFIMTVVPAFRITGLPVIRTEQAVINTFVCRLDMKIAVKESQVTIISFPDEYCKITEKR